MKGYGALAVVFAFALSACSGLGPSDPTRNWSEEELYRQAKTALDDRDYEVAIDYYGKLGARFPFGTRAAQGQLDLMYAYHKAREPDSATEEADRFIQFNPGHPGVPYAYYLKGLVKHDRRQGWWRRFVRSDPSERDLTGAESAFGSFKELLERFPESRYVDDSRERMGEIREALARRELRVAEFYLARSAWVAAANRARNVVSSFPGSASVAPALAIMVRAYRTIGLDDLAEDSLRVLRANYPGYPEPRPG